MYGNNFVPRKPPVREGEEIDVRIEAVGEKGDGVAKKDGFVLFVPNVSEGDEVRIRITKVLRKVGFAEVIGQASGPVKESAPPVKKSAADEQAKQRQDIVSKATQIESTEDFGEEADDVVSDDFLDDASSDDDIPEPPEEEEKE